MKQVWYLPTVDEREKPLIVKVRIIGERDGFRMVRQFGSHEDIIVHIRHSTQNWLGAWIKAKRISKSRRQRNLVRDVGGRGKVHNASVHAIKRGRDGDDLTKPVTVGETTHFTKPINKML